MSDTDARFRAHFRHFSLRAMLLVVLVIAGALGWTLHKVREQKIAVAELEKLQCRVQYRDSGPLTILERLRKAIGEKEYRDVTFVDCLDSPIGDSGLVQLRALPYVEWLNLAASQISDAGLENLRGLSQLTYLRLDLTQITDAGLVNIQGLEQLQELRLGGPSVTDAATVSLRQLARLQILDLRDTNVTDAGLKNLHGLTQLFIVELSGTQVTKRGVADLQRALPACVPLWNDE